MNPMKLLQLKGAWDTFVKNHPKFPLFLKAVGENGACEGCVYEFTVTTPEGKTFQSNLKLTSEDVALIGQLKDTFM